MTEARVAMVTGAARGIGAATVRTLAGRGYRVVAMDACAGSEGRVPAGVRYELPGREALFGLAEEVGDHVLPLVGDVRHRREVQVGVDLAVERFGRLDAVVAAAAVLVGGRPLWEMHLEELTTLWEVDVLGVWNTAASAVPAMLAGPDPSGCRFVALSSVAGSRGIYHLAAYNTAKHAVVGLVRGLAADLGKTGVTAVAVSPGSTETDLLTATAQLYAMPDNAGFAESHLLGRLLRPEELAAVIAFCCSVDGAVLNGSIVHADGGFVG